MPRKSTKTILAALKRAGVKIESDDQDKVQEMLEDLELTAEEFLGPDQIILSKDEHRELKDDLTTLRKRMKTAEKEATDLREAMDTGDSDNKRKAETYKGKLDELEPKLDKLLETMKKTWKASADKIPEAVAKEFHVPEKDKELTTDQMLQNVEKFEEYVRIGLIDGEKPVEDPAPGPRDQPRVGPKDKDKKPTLDQLAEMPTSTKIESGYKPRETPKP